MDVGETIAPNSANRNRIRRTDSAWARRGAARKKRAREPHFPIWEAADSSTCSSSISRRRVARRQTWSSQVRPCSHRQTDGRSLSASIFYAARRPSECQLGLTGFPAPEPAAGHLRAARTLRLRPKLEGADAAVMRYSRGRCMLNALIASRQFRRLPPWMASVGC